MALRYGFVRMKFNIVASINGIAVRDNLPFKTLTRIKESNSYTRCVRWYPFYLSTILLFSVLYDTRFFVSTLLLINRGGKKFSISWYLLDISRLVKGLVKKEKIEGTNRSDHGSVSNKLSPRFFALHAFVESLFEFFEILIAGCVATDRFERVDSYVFPFHRISPYARNFPSVPFFAPEPDG